MAPDLALSPRDDARLRRFFGRVLTAVATATAILAASGVASAQAQFSVVHAFTQPSAPSSPQGGLIQGTDGNFYGTSSYGGAHDWGTVFKITPTGAVTVLHEFNLADGAFPHTALLQASDGNFYGTTSRTVFKMTPDGGVTVLHSFTQAESSPYAAVIQATDGDFYGTTYGSVFKVTAAGTFTILHSFSGGLTEPSSVWAPLVQATDGNFYGTSRGGGSFGRGTIFRMTPAGAVTVLHAFGNGSDGDDPFAGLIQATDGNFYGTTQFGGSADKGTIFRMTPAGDLRVIYSFSLIGNAVGSYPRAPLIQGADGYFYGSITSFSGAAFRMAPDGTVSSLHTFVVGAAEGSEPLLGFLRAADGNIYGTAASGGEVGRGTVFKMTPAGDVTVLTAFPGDEQGSYPRALVRANDGKFYGTTGGGGPLNRGTVFALTPDGLVTWLHSFTGNEGAIPTALVQARDGNLYGTTYARDISYSRGGTAFRMTPSGTLTVLHEFTPSALDGLGPVGLIEGIDGNFYGTTSGGGAFGDGTVFRMTPDGAVTVLHAFAGGTADGAYPSAGVVQAPDGTLYGTTSGGGTLGFGTVFKLVPDGSFFILQSVNATVCGSDYDSPSWMPGVTLATDGNLFGVVLRFGYCNSTAFRVTPEGILTILGEFDGRVSLPSGPPIQAPDGNLYGLAFERTVYKITLDGTFNTLAISGAERWYFGSTFISGGDGYLYGTAGDSRYPSESGGAVFRLRVPMPALMTVDLPQPDQTVSEPFALAGWALNLGPSPDHGTGVDAVHVWAYPGTGGAPIFVGAAAYGVSRPDVAVAFGDRFAQAGYQLTVRGLATGTYRLIVYAHGTESGTFDNERSLIVTVQAPVSRPRVEIDAPARDAIVGPSFVIAGWAVDLASSIGPGIDVVHLYAYPNPGSGSPPIFLGAANYGGSRPDVGAIFGASFVNSAYGLTVSGLAPGPYRLVAFARSIESGAYTAQTTDITVRVGNPMMFIDSPTSGAAVTTPFAIGGWAADTDAAVGTGVDAIHVWAFPASGLPVFLGAAAYGEPRPDVGSVLGDRFSDAGYSLVVGSLAAGAYQIVVFAHSTVTGSFNQARVVTVTVF